MSSIRQPIQQFQDYFEQEDLNWEDDFSIFDGEDLGDANLTDEVSDRPSHKITAVEVAATKIKINQLYNKVKKSDSPDPELLEILSDALKDIRSVNNRGKMDALKFEEAVQLYDVVQQALQNSDTENLDDFGNLEGVDGTEEDSSSRALNKDFKDDDTPVDFIDKKTGTALYKSNPEVVLHNYFNEDGIKNCEVKNVSQVTLYPANPSDKFLVEYDSGLNKFKIITSSTKEVKTYYVDSTTLTKVILVSSNVDTSKLNVEQRDKVQIGLDEAKDTKDKKLDIIKSVVWPANGIKTYVDCRNTNSSHAGGGGSRAEEISDLLDNAVKNKNWDGVAKYIRDNSTHDWNAGWTQYNDEYMNDAVRKVVTGIYRASGGTSYDDPKFMGMLKLIPDYVRQAMRDGVLAHNGELKESHGEQWDSQKTADILDASLISETGNPEDDKKASVL